LALILFYIDDFSFTNPQKMGTKWDVIAISAMNSDQKSAFDQQLKQLEKSSMIISRMADQLRVYADEPVGVKIGKLLFFFQIFFDW
jgi:hypothetical protein